jgi:2'-hydroxyisoflavone reductase
MRILVIGGTIFVGRHIVEVALRRGHEVTLFNRGRGNAELFPEARKIIGDRRKDMHALSGCSWDVVIDSCGYVPHEVQTSADALKSGCDLYAFISTGAVYKDKSRTGITEEDALLELDDFDTQEMVPEKYGELKAGCESVVQEVFSDKSLIIRPGLVVGPHDPTDRFTYWPVRVEAGGRILAPGNPRRPVQFIDVRDLADWTVSMVERKAVGIYNAIGPDYSLSMSQLLEDCKFVSASDAEFAWISDEELQRQNVDRWTDLPLWIPENGEERGFLSRNNSRAIAAGLRFRALRETIADTLQWWHRERAGADLKAGISREREAQIFSSCKC